MMERVLAVRIAAEIVPATIVNDKVWRVAVTTHGGRSAMLSDYEKSSKK